MAPREREPLTPIHLRVNRSLLKEIDAETKRLDVTRTALIKLALRQYLDREKPPSHASSRRDVPVEPTSPSGSRQS